MAVMYDSIAGKGARHYRLSGQRSDQSWTLESVPAVGWGYASDGYYTNEYGYRAGLEFDGELPAVPEPAAADVSVYNVTVRLNGAAAMALSVGVLSAAMSDSAQGRYNQLGGSANVVGSIAAGSTAGTLAMTRAQAANALAYGVKVFPAQEFGTQNSLVRASGAVVFTPVNPAARGRISDLNPGNYSSLVKGQANVIGYMYRHDDGGYAQAYLSVIARNQDTGEVVTICRKASVSVADGARGSFTIPADTLGEGRWTLTVCAAPAASATYYPDTSDFWTTGQEFTFVVRENPSSSAVTCDGKPVPTVSWSSSGQAAYQVRFGEYDSGARVGAETSFTVPRIFRDGAYPVQVRTATSAGNWSAWTDVEYAEVANVEPEAGFSAAAAQDGTNAVLTWNGALSLAWEQGAIASATGKDVNPPSNTRIRTTGYLAVTADGLTATIPSGMQWYCMRYSSPSEDDFVGAEGWKSASGVTQAQTGEYVRFVLSYTTNNTQISPDKGALLRAGYPQVQAAHYAVFRDGEMIAVTDSDAVQYVDRLGAGGEYEVLAVTAGHYYRSSGPLPLRLRLAADLISADGGYTWIACRLTPDRKSQPEDIREDVTYVYYAGSDKPAAFRTHQRQRTKTFSFIFFTRAAARALRPLVGREIIVKTTRGEQIRGVIGEMQWGDGRQITASFSVREVRGEEDGLEYPA